MPLYQSVISNARVDLLKEILKYDIAKIKRNGVLWAIIAFAPHDREKMETTNKMLGLLRGHGWDFNVKDSRDATPLHWAARIGNEAIIEVLLARGVDSEQKDSRGFTYADELMPYNGSEHNGYNLQTYDVVPEKDATEGHLSAAIDNLEGWLPRMEQTYPSIYEPKREARATDQAAKEVKKGH